MQKKNSNAIQEVPSPNVDYPPIVKQLHQLLCLAIKEKNFQRFTLNNILKYEKKESKRNVCAKIITKNMPIVQCRDCQVDHTCIICLECFQAGNHQNHKYQIRSGAGGCCDCGDRQAWKPSGFCRAHTGEAQKVNIPDQQVKKFVQIWRYLFYWYFQKQLESLGFYLTRFLNILIPNMEYNVMFYNLCSSKFDQKAHPGLPKDMYIYNILENMYIYSLPNNQKEFANLLITAFPNYQFKKLMIRSFFRTYSRITAHQKNRITDVSYQLVTSYQLVRYVVRDEGLVLTCPNNFSAVIFGAQNAFENIFNYINDLKNISKLSDGVNLEYYRLYFKDFENLKGLTSYMPKVQSQWSNTPEDSEITDALLVELMVLTECISDAVTVIKKDPALLFDILVRLIDFVATIAVKNLVFFPYHRILAVFLATYLQFKPNIRQAGPLFAQIKMLEEKLSKNIEIFMPFFQCIKFTLEGKINPKFRDLHVRFFEYYVDVYRSLFSLDMFMAKLFVNIRGVKINNALQLLLNSTEQQRVLYMGLKEGNPTEMSNQTIKIIKSVSCTLGYIIELCVSVSEQINLCGMINQNVEMYSHRVDQLTRQYFNTDQQPVTIQSLEEFRKKYIAWDVKIDEYIKKYSKYDKTAKKFVLLKEANDQQRLAVDFYNSKGSALKSSQKQRSFEKQALNPDSELCALLLEANTQESVLRVLQTSFKIYDKVYENKEFEKQLRLTINEFAIEVLKFYYVRLRTNQFTTARIKALLQQVGQHKLLDSNTKSSITKAFELTQLVVQKSEAESAFKQKGIEARRRATEEMKNKQKKALAKMQMEQQHNAKVDLSESQTCVFCHQTFTQKSFYIYCGCLTASSLYNNSQIMSLTKLMAERKQPDELVLLGALIQHHRKIPLPANVVITSCMHPMHYDCYLSFGQKNKNIFCPLCKRKTNIIVPGMDKLEKLDVADTKSKLESSITFIQKMSRMYSDIMGVSNTKTLQQKFLIVMMSFVEVLGFNGELEYEWFINKMMKFYQTILRSLQLNYKFAGSGFCQVLTQLIQHRFQSKEVSNWSSYLQGSFEWLILNVLISYLDNKNSMSIINEYVVKNYSTNSQINKIIIRRANLLSYLVAGKEFQPPQVSMPAQIWFFVPAVPLKFVELPHKYQPISVNRGKCINCKQAINNIYLCLLCGWLGCVDCKETDPRQHTYDNHSSNCLFINIETTRLVYITDNKSIRNGGKLYSNDLGEGFQILSNWQEYSLDDKQYNQAKKLLLKHQLPVYVQYCLRKEPFLQILFQ